MHDQNQTICEFLHAAAARQPAPGGGSVAALAGALAASMGEMAVNYSIGKKGLEPHADHFKAALAQLHSARNMLLELMVEDQNAFEALSAARKLSASSEREKAIESATAVCISVPQAIAATAVAILDLADSLVERVNPFLLSDLAVCADLATTTVRCGIYNVKVNLMEVSDPQKRWEIEATNGKLLSRAIMLIQRISPRIWQRIARPA